MYRTIMVPVDLAHLSVLQKALDTAGNLAKHFEAGITYVGVTTNTPTEVAHNPDEFTAKLDEFARTEAGKHGVNGTGKAYVSTDPTIDLDRKIAAAVDDVGADLVVMASHIPGFWEHVWASHAGRLATNAKVSVFVVR